VASTWESTFRGEEKQQEMICEKESSIQNPAVFNVSMQPTMKDLELKVQNLEKTLKTQKILNLRLEKSSKQQKNDQNQIRNKSKARIRKLKAENAKLEQRVKSNAKLAATVEKLKICLKKQKLDHQRAQNKLEAQCRELKSTNSELNTIIKDVRGKGYEDITELPAKIKRDKQIKSQGSKHETALKRINELETNLAANSARMKENTNSRFRRPKNFLQEDLSRMKWVAKPRYERRTTFPITKNSRFARPDWDSPKIREPSINCETKSKKVKQHGRGCLLLWPKSMLNEAEELFQIARKTSKDSGSVVALLAIPVPITIA
jgi:myosin heavy subunit